VLEVDAIDVCYGDLKVLRDVSLSVRAGEIVALVGSNGAGKSTLLRTISGLIRPARGSIRFDGIDLIAQPPYGIVDMGLCMVPEEKKIFRDMTVLENLEMGAFLARARQERARTLEWVYDVFPRLKERNKQKAGTLSGGEQQMLLVARALMTRPKLLLLDEISFGLAPILVQTIFKTIREIHKSTGLTILLVEQNVRMALEAADRAYILESGAMVAEGSAQEFLRSEEVRDAYFGISEEELCSG
jgi:branched-chain amino acid transport system ATP-binding protein